MKFRKNQLIGPNKVLRVVDGQIVKGTRNRLHYKTICTVCQRETISRYDMYSPTKGCIRGCQNYVSIIGTKREEYEVLKYTKPSISGGLFECRCICGNIFYKTFKSIKCGSIRGCGCVKYRELLSSYQRNARKRNLPFNLTPLQFHSIIENNCHYCGMPPRQLSFKKHVRPVIANGIDRKDNSQGYTLENSLPCCTDCNRAKQGKDYHYFVQWLERIKTHRINDNLTTN